MTTQDLSALTQSHFQPHLNERFDISILAQIGGQAPTPQTVPLELIAVENIPGSQPDQSRARAGFSLLFMGPPSSHHLPQRIYTLQHATLGALDLFIAPVGPSPMPQADRTRMCYQAIFN